jgi:hypothetical protein
MLSPRNILVVLAGMVLLAATLVCGIAILTGPKAESRATAPLPAAVFFPTSVSNGAPLASPSPISPPSLQFATLGTPTPLGPPPEVLESRRLTLEYPQNIRSGDSDLVRLTLEVDTLGNITPTAQFPGNRVKGETVSIPNLYATHNIVAEARLDLAGPEIRPNNAIAEPLLPGESVTFYWSVHPTDTGTYRGTVWLIMIFVDKVSREETRKAISAQPVEIESMNLFGLTGAGARATGGIGALVGAVLGFPFASDIMKWILGRLIRHAK